VTKFFKKRPALHPHTPEGGPRWRWGSCFRLAATLCVSLAVLAPCQPRKALPPQTGVKSSSALASGRPIFTSTCAGCHGLDGRGGEHAPNIATRAEVRRLTDQQIFHIVHDGSASRSMPAFGTTFSAAQIRAVIQYLRLLQGAPGAATMPGNPQEGKALFFGQAGCSGCHMVQGQGGFIASDLTDYAAAKSPDEIRSALTNSPDSSGPRQRLATIVTKSGEKIVGLVRNEDNFSIQLQSLDGTFHLLDRSEVQSIVFDSRSLMPSDYATKLSPEQIDDVISFLLSAAASAASPAPPSSRPPARAGRANSNE
jgi:cytochrome c oxidase cbb3-type subunit III